jgi:energy-coupling factor transporter ATP-binding protein EcfA2
MRYFNTHGPVNTVEHYVVPRTDLVAEIAAQIEEGKYFTIFAPRQMGKTTLLRDLAVVLRQATDMLPIVLNFEAFEGWTVEEFLQGLTLDLQRGLEDFLAQRTSGYSAAVKQIFDRGAPVNFFELRELLLQLHEAIADYRIVLIIDEFDGTPQAAISSLLQTWRQIYLNQQPPRSIHSVVLVGLQNIATLNFGRSSPFNIARQARLVGFTVAEVQDLFAQYTAESGQTFAPGVIAEIHSQTAGHPFLVNRLGALLTEELVTDRSQPIQESDLTHAIKLLVRERNYNFESLIRNANPRREEVLNILFGAERAFNQNDPLVHDLYMHGVISETAKGFCQIANPIYSAVLLAAFRSPHLSIQGAMLVNGYDFRPNVVNGQLQIPILLSRFREFMERRGREAFKISETPQEATGQYMLMAYLDVVVRQVGGDLFSEVYSGEGRLDLIIVHKGQRFVVETKIWRGPVAYDEGLTQLTDYLAREGQAEGYYVVFHARPRIYGKLPFAKLEFVQQHNQKTIHVFVVRLGKLFDETEEST